MRYITIATVVLFSLPAGTAFSAGDGPAERAPATKVESFIAKKGALITKEFYRLGRLGSSLQNAEFKAIVASETGPQSQRVRGVHVTVSSNLRIERTNVSFLDAEEAESLVGALGYLQKLASEWSTGPTEPSREAVFATKGEFKIGIFRTGNGTDVRMFVSSGTVNEVIYFGETDNLEEIKGFVQRGLEILASR